MSPDEDDLNRLEQRLGGWRPSLGGLDRDRLLYEAGRGESAARGNRLVKAMAAVSIATTLAAFGLGTAWRLEHDRASRLTAELALTRSEAARPPYAPSHPTYTTSSYGSPVHVASREPPDPFSYLALSRRIVNGRLEFDPPRRPPASRDDKPSPPRPEPLRAGDRDRLLDL
jgi:hypothetical protein